MINLYAGYHSSTRPADLMLVVDHVAARIKKWLGTPAAKHVTHIACCGCSGQSIGWPVSYKLGIPLCVIRKPNEMAHTGKLVGDGSLKDYIILDDFIATGNTVNYIRNSIRGTDYDKSSDCKAIFTYHESHDNVHTFDASIDGAVAAPVIGCKPPGLELW